MSARHWLNAVPNGLEFFLLFVIYEGVCIHQRAHAASGNTLWGETKHLQYCMGQRVQQLCERSVRILMWDNYSTTFDQTFDHCAPRTVVRVRIWQRIKFYEFLVLDKRWK